MSLPEMRPCCTLTAQAYESDLSCGTNILDPARLGEHRTASEAVGIVYTCASGFVDFGHVRDQIDLTKYVHDELVAIRDPAVCRSRPQACELCQLRTGCVIPTWHGEARIRQRQTMDAGDLMRVARSIAYDDSVVHEIDSYELGDLVFTPGLHNSSFSPEDLISNYLGTWVAAEALRRTTQAGERSFDREVDNVLNWLVRQLGAQPPHVTRDALRRIRGPHGWVADIGCGGQSDTGNLLRRNFHWQQPYNHTWSVSGAALGTCGTPAVGLTLGDIEPFSRHYRFRAEESYWRTDFPAKITAIKRDAQARYGTNYDHP